MAGPHSGFIVGCIDENLCIHNGKVKDRSSTPVSEVLASCHTADNPVQSEYIILEKTGGVQLTDVWDGMPEQERVDLIRGFAQFESKLAMLKFPGYGALYEREALPAVLKENPERVINVDKMYCLGPAYHGSWPGGYAANPEDYAQYAGPCERHP